MPGKKKKKKKLSKRRWKNSRSPLAYYVFLIAEAFESVYGYSGQKQQTSLMNILMQLRKCVNHPYLFDGR